MPLHIPSGNSLVPGGGPHVCRRRVVEHAAEVLAGGAHADKVAGVEARVQPDRALGAHARRVRPAAGCAQARCGSRDAAGRCSAPYRLLPEHASPSARPLQSNSCCLLPDDLMRCLDFGAREHVCHIVSGNVCACLRCGPDDEKYARASGYVYTSDCTYKAPDQRQMRATLTTLLKVCWALTNGHSGELDRRASWECRERGHHHIPLLRGTRPLALRALQHPLSKPFFIRTP